MTDVTLLLSRVRNGEDGARERLLELVYGELRRIARSAMASERSDHTLEPTALAHEAYLRLAHGADEALAFENRAHFFAAAAQAIRRLLVEHARARTRLKRGGARNRIDLDSRVDVAAEPGTDERVLAVDDALERLARFDSGKARLVELRFFAGMSVDEVALALGVSPSTVAREWRVTRAWLFSELGGVRCGC